MKELLELRKKRKSKKPTFLRRDCHKKARVSKKWRKPKGLQNKMRLNKKGYNRVRSSGWSSPQAVRGLHSSGLEMITVSNVSQLESLKENQGIVISGKVGDKKRKLLINEATKQGIKILNLDSNTYLQKIKEEMDARKKAKELRDARKKQSEKEAAKKEKKKEKKEEKTEDEKKIEDKKELDKVLTKKE